MIPDPWDCSHTDELMCPYCGHPQSSSWEVDGDSGIYDCDVCARPFHYERQVSVSYSTVPLIGPHPQTDWEQQQELEHEQEQKANP